MDRDPWVHSQSDVTDGMLQDLMHTIHKYDGAVSLATAIGVLEIAKQEVLKVLRDGAEDQEED